MMTQPSPDRRVWRNWAGTAAATPARWSRPRNEADISAAVKDAAAAGLTVRALGSGHSFTAVAATSGVALDLSGWTGITAADTGTGLVTARSGTTLRALNAGFGALCRLGRASPRLIPALNRFSSAVLSARTYTDASYRVFVTLAGYASPSPSTPFHVNHWATSSPNCAAPFPA